LSSEISLGRRFFAEFLGDFLFVFVGAGSAVATGVLGFSNPGASLLIAALGNGLGLAVAVSITMGISGGVLNPAVTIGLFLGKKLKGKDVLPYIIAQLVGATLAGAVLVALVSSSYGSGYGAPSLYSGISIGQGILFELVMTFFLVLAVYGTIVDKRAPKIAGFGVGLMVVADVLAGGPFTGAAMNPARAMGPMIASLTIPSYWWIYWIGPIVGAGLAGLVYNRVLEKDN